MKSNKEDMATRVNKKMTAKNSVGSMISGRLMTCPAIKEEIHIIAIKEEVPK